MMIEPRTWKWMVPGMLVPVFALMAYGLAVEESLPLWIRLLFVVPLFWCILMASQAVSGYRAYYRAAEADVLERKQQALALTPVSALARALQGLHPSYAKILSMHTQTVWLLKEQRVEGMTDYILYGTRIPVRLALVVHVLTHSTEISVMAERMLSDGSKQFDPDEQVTDRDQYRELLAYWYSQGRVTSATGNQTAQWIYPWTPATVARAMDIDLEDGDDQA